MILEIELKPKKILFICTNNSVRSQMQRDFSGIFVAAVAMFTAQELSPQR